MITFGVLVSSTEAIPDRLKHNQSDASSACLVKFMSSLKQVKAIKIYPNATNPIYFPLC